MSGLLKLNQYDNVAIALEPLKKNQLVSLALATVTLAEDVETMHKVACGLIKQGQPIIKYGQAIGIASRNIVPGEHVHLHNCAMAATAQDYGFCKYAKPTEHLPLAQCAQFLGYKRRSGKVGTRNYIGIITTVNCSATAATQIAAYFNQPQQLTSYPNIDGVVALTHDSGCGMRATGEGFEVLQRTLRGYATHPNMGGVLILGLGCETMQIARLLEHGALGQQGLFAAFNIQDTSGTRDAITKGISIITEMLPKVNAATREPIPVSELTVAMQCGGSDAFSGITANPALGAAGDILVRHGGTIVYSETPEIYGAEHLLTQRARTPEVARQLLDRIKWWEQYTNKHGFELNNNPSPGNKAGGLTTIIEKSLGAQAKSGTTELRAVYEYAEPITEKGLVFMDSPGYDPVSVTGQVASGANLVCFTTGRGSAFGCKPVPSIKLSSNNELYRRMREDIDINCGDIISGRLDVLSSGEQIFQEIIAVASGKLTASELLGYGANEFNPWKIGAVV